MELKSFEELVDFLRTFETWGDRGGYDMGGVVHLLGACLDNLERNAVESETEEIQEYLDQKQRDFLRKLADKITPEHAGEGNSLPEREEA